MNEYASIRLLLNGTNILLIEDNPANQLIVRHFLEIVSCNVTCADNGQQALEKIAAGSYDLVIMDIQMPVMNGYETTRHIRNISKFRYLPIITMTANTTQQNRECCLAAGMDDFILKPIDRNQMYRVLVKWLSDKSQWSEAMRDLPSDGSSVSFVNISALKYVFNNDTELVHRFSRKFIQVTEETLIELETAKTRCDIKSMECLGHKLKFSARTMGADYFADLCDGLEIAGMNNDWRQAERLSSRILESFQSIKRQIEQILQTG